MTEVGSRSGEEHRRVPAERSRKLLSPEIEAAYGIYEFYDNVLQTRLIELPNRSPHTHTHSALMYSRIPVLPTIPSSEGALLIVPNGTLSLRRLLRFIARDVPTYGEVFSELGSIVRKLDESGIGMPEVRSGRTILDNFAYAIDDKSHYGGRMYLVPPYELNSDRSAEQLADGIQAELSVERALSSLDVQSLMGKLNEGWHDNNV